MKREQLVNAIEKIDDRFISEAETYDPEKAKKALSPYVFILPAAAAASVAMIITVNSIYNRHDPSGNFEINNFEVTSGVSESVASADDETEITRETRADTVSDAFTELITASETETQVTGDLTDVVTVNTEEQKVTAAPVTQKTERAEEAPVTVPGTEAPVNESQTAPEPETVTEATTDSHSKPQPPVTTEGRAFKPEPPATTADSVKEQLPVTTTELIQEEPTVMVQPLFFKDFEDISTVVQNYDLSDYPEYCHEAYTEMFERIKQDGFMYVPDVEEDSQITLSCRNINVCPYSAYEDIAVGCYTDYDGSLFRISTCYADRNKLYSSSGQADYFSSRLMQEFEESWFAGDKEILIKDIGVWHCAYAFIDDEHYCIIKTTDSREALFRFLNTVNFKKTLI